MEDWGAASTTFSTAAVTEQKARVTSGLVTNYKVLGRGGGILYNEHHISVKY